MIKLTLRITQDQKMSSFLYHPLKIIQAKENIPLPVLKLLYMSESGNYMGNNPSLTNWSINTLG